MNINRNIHYFKPRKLYAAFTFLLLGLLFGLLASDRGSGKWSCSD